MSLQEQIRQVRIRNGLDQEHFALCFNPPVTRSAVSRWESHNESHCRPTAKYMKQLHDLFGVNIKTAREDIGEEAIDELADRIASEISEVVKKEIKEFYKESVGKI